MRKKKKWMLFVISFFSLVSCVPKPPDVPACESLSSKIYVDPKSGHSILQGSPTCEDSIGEPECGHCVFIVSGKEMFIGDLPKNYFNGKPWSELKAESIFLPAQESYAPLSAYVINSCKKMNCEKEITPFRIKLGVLKSASNENKSP